MSSVSPDAAKIAVRIIMIHKGSNVIKNRSMNNKEREI